MLADLGPYFMFEHAVAADPRDWRTLSASLAPSVLDEQIEKARGRLNVQGPVGRSAAELRAVASTVAMGMFSRLLSPGIGAALVGGLTIRPDPDTTWLGLTDDSPALLRTTAELEEPDLSRAITGLAIPLLETIHRHFHVSERVLYGNLAASVVGTCGVVQMIRPELSAEVDALRAELLSAPPLAETGTVSGEFVRNSCCLIYQLPLDYICGNCVLVAHGTPTAQQRGEAMAPTRRRLSRQSRPDFSKPPFRRSTTR